MNSNIQIQWCYSQQSPSLLYRLHRLWVPEQISFRLAVLVYCCCHGSAPGCLASDLQCVSDLTHVRDCALQACRHLSVHASCVLTSAIVPYRQLQHLIRISQFGRHHHCQFFAADWRPSLLHGLTAAPTSTTNSALTKTWLFLPLRVLAVLGLHATLKSIRSSTTTAEAAAAATVSSNYSRQQR